jgi:SAM-dependent methyltransferase
MARVFDERAFQEAYQRYIAEGRFQEVPEYYPRYRSRYRALLKRYAEIVGPGPLDVLDVGGGQLALLCKVLWQDRAVVADLEGPHLDYLGGNGVETVVWNLCSEAQPFLDRFDVIFLSEVIAHLPFPPHIVLERLRKGLRPGGKLICSTPNLYRLRNVVYLACGIRLFDYFREVKKGWPGAILDYSADHLRWQLEEAGFRDCRIELRQFHHNPGHWLARLLSWLAYPLFLVPRFRDNLLAVATAP